VWCKRIVIPHDEKPSYRGEWTPTETTFWGCDVSGNHHIPRKIQHTPISHPTQLWKISLHSLLVEVARGVFQRCVETTLDWCKATTQSISKTNSPRNRLPSSSSPALRSRRCQKSCHLTCLLATTTSRVIYSIHVYMCTCIYNIICINNVCT